MTTKKNQGGYNPDWKVDTDEEQQKNDGKDYQGSRPASTSHGRSGSTPAPTIYQADNLKPSDDSGDD